VPDAIDDALRELVLHETAPLVAQQRAAVTCLDGAAMTVSVRPLATPGCPFTVTAQSDSEISFFLGPPDEPETVTVDVYRRERQELLGEVRSYVRAILEGHVGVQKRRGRTAGRVHFSLPEGERLHRYNVLFGLRLRRAPIQRFAAY